MATYYIEAAGSDANAGTSAGAGNAWLTLQKAADTATAGDTVYVKSDKTYSEQVDFDTQTGTVTAPIKFIGYTTTTSDGGKATWDGSTYCIVSNGTPDYVRFSNFILTSCSSFCIDIVTASTDNWWFRNCDFTASTSVLGRSAGFNLCNNWTFIKCNISGMSASDFGSILSVGITIIGCKIIDNTGNGITLAAYVGIDWLISDNIIAGNTLDGINIGGSAGTGVILRNTIQGNSGDGIDLSGAGNLRQLIYGNIIAGHNGAGDVGLRVGTLSGTTVLICDRNFYYDNTTHKSGTDTAGDNDVTLSADPFTNSGSDNWTLNNTAGGGASVRASYGPVFDGTNIGYVDGGALQHQDAGGSSGGGLKLIGSGGLIG